MFQVLSILRVEKSHRINEIKSPALAWIEIMFSSPTHIVTPWHFSSLRFPEFILQHRVVLSTSKNNPRIRLSCILRTPVWQRERNILGEGKLWRHPETKQRLEEVEGRGGGGATVESGSSVWASVLFWGTLELAGSGCSVDSVDHRRFQTILSSHSSLLSILEANLDIPWFAFILLLSLLVGDLVGFHVYPSSLNKKCFLFLLSYKGDSYAEMMDSWRLVSRTLLSQTDWVRS